MKIFEKIKNKLFKKNNKDKNLYLPLKPKNKILDVLILGGGPIGLFMGYKLLKKGNNITIFEKRKDYTRHNIVGLMETKNMDIISMIPSEIMDDLVKTSCYGSYYKGNKKKCYKDFYNSKPYENIQPRMIYVIINELEL